MALASLLSRIEHSGSLKLVRLVFVEGVCLDLLILPGFESWDREEAGAAGLA